MYLLSGMSCSVRSRLGPNPKKRKRQADYINEIPFEKQPAPGFYDVSEENIDNVPIQFKGLRRHHLDEKSRDGDEKVSLASGW